MKVVGTGSPMMLTIRLKTSEVRLWRDELEERRTSVINALAHGRQTAVPARVDDDAENGHDELFLISRLLDDLRRPAPPGQPREIVGPTWLLDQVIRGAAGEAIERLHATQSEFALDRGRVTPDELRAALDTACASTSTLIGLDHAVNHAVDD